MTARETIREAAKRIGEAGDRDLCHRLAAFADRLDAWMDDDRITALAGECAWRSVPRGDTHEIGTCLKFMLTKLDADLDTPAPTGRTR